MPAPPALGLPPRHATSPAPRLFRSTHLVGGLAVLVALWLGVTAPSSSPVSGGPAQLTGAANTARVDDPDLDRVQVRGRGDRGRFGDGR